jgi:hypothetical protein
MMSNRSLAVLLSAAMLAACKGDGVQDITAPLPGAAVKFFNFGVNAPAVNFYANDTKLTAISSTSCTPPTDPACLAKGIESTTGVASGAAAAGGFYVGVTPGQYTLSGRIAAAIDNGLAVASTPATLADGKFYSYYTSGIYDATAKKSDAFVVEDVLPAVSPDPTIAYVRFVNAISNSSPMTLYVKNTVSGQEVAVGAAVAYKAAGAFIAVPAGVYDLNTRAAGSATNLITRTAVSFNAGAATRVYTITARGDMTVTSTTATTRPQLDNTANR